MTINYIVMAMVSSWIHYFASIIRYLKPMGFFISSKYSDIVTKLNMWQIIYKHDIFY